LQDLREYQSKAFDPESIIFNCHPNPFNPVVNLDIEIQSAGHITLTIFDITGRQVVNLFNGFKHAGLHQIEFNGKYLPSAVYFAKLEVGGAV